MSKSQVKRSAAILISLILIALTAYPAFALGGITAESESVDGITPQAAKQIRPLKNSATSPAEVRKEKIQNRLETKKENVEKRIEAIKEKLASREAAMKAKLQAFKDQKKAQIAERVNTNLNMINRKRTEQMRKHLSSMSEILDKLEARINQGSPDIKDPTEARAAVASARDTIAAVSADTTSQAEKDYTIQVSSESRVRADAKTQRDKLHTDLLALRKKVIEAKQAVGNAIRVARSEKGETVSGKQ